MKKTILAAALAVMAAGAFAHGSTAGVSATSVSATYATAGNGGTSVSKASNFAVGFGGTSGSTGLGKLSVNVPNCDVPTTATVLGVITTVKGSATSMGGSTASNVSTSNGSGAAFSYGNALTNVEKTVNGVGGGASVLTETWAGAGKNQSNSSFASQTASFEAKGGTGIVVVTEPGKYGPKIVATGVGAATSGVSTVGKSYQVVGGGNNGCGGSCPQNVGQLFNGTETSWNTKTGSNTVGTAWTLSNVSID